jgi:lipid-binding SYLF domain-containing protein
MRRSQVALAAVMLVSFALAGGCSTVPKDEKERTALETDADKTLDELKQADSSLSSVLDESKGYAVFPSIGKGGFIIGGGYGRGTLYEEGKMVGYTDMTQAAIGALIGGQTFSELIVFKTPEALSNFKTGNFTFGANANAIALDKGAAAATEFKDGVAIFTKPKQGLMAEASLAGQKFKYVPLSEAGGPAEADVASERVAPTTTEASPRGGS